MVERTKRGEDEHRQEENVMAGEPLESARQSDPGDSKTTITREKGAEPLVDPQRDERVNGK